ncbi:MAG TPA: hypothetical protein VK254_01020 [Candidatus Bathyarchaeia archaeon]|nr:hypothetical protein [Candidatus Bathyarchaeia archaeon]
MKIIKLNNRGFSFVESLVAMAILVYILGALVVIYSSYSRFYNFLQNKIAMGSSSRAAMKELRNDALQADQIVASHSFSGIQRSTDQHTVVLEIPSIDGSGNIVDGKYDYAAFYLSGDGLYRTMQADAASSRTSGAVKITDAVQTLTFSYDNQALDQATKIDADLEMQIVSGGQTVSSRLYQVIYLRNK